MKLFRRASSPWPKVMAKGASQGSSSSRPETAIFGAVLALFVALALEPLWSEAIPPLQDYPSHLAQVAVLLADDDSSLRAQP